jgi:hypothetical protein
MIPLGLTLFAELGCRGEALVGVDNGPRTHRGEVSPLGGPCDGAGDGSDEAACDDCRACAASERCTSETAQCDADPDCVQLRDCIEACDELPGCTDECVVDWPEGAVHLTAVRDCALCECMSDCGATEACLGL